MIYLSEKVLGSIPNTAEKKEEKEGVEKDRNKGRKGKEHAGLSVVVYSNRFASAHTGRISASWLQQVFILRN